MLTAPQDRIATIDLIRGFAVMGILLMNIIAFSMPEGAYLNPNSWGGETVADRLAWLLSFILVDGKMRGLFSLLFGASMLLLMDRAEMAGGNGVHRNLIRCFWLLMIGTAHYFLLWWGDILSLYAVLGPIAMLFAGRQPMQLVKLAFLAFAIEFAILAAIILAMHYADALTPNVIGLTDQDKIGAEIALTRGDWAGITAHKAADFWHWTLAGLKYMTFDTLGFMLLGMAMLKGGFLTGKWAREQYVGVARHCFLIGLVPMLLLGIWAWGSGFDVTTTFGVMFAWSFPFRIPMTVGYAALILAMAASGAASALLARVQAVGRMALSNYLLTSLLMCATFYGWGLGLFASVSRAQVYLYVLPVWAIMLLWSPLWLGRFRQGPMEGLWRSLILPRPAPMRINR